MEFIKAAACLVLSALVLYFKANAGLRERAGELISEAEAAYRDTVKAGGLKHAYVVERLYSLIPFYLRPIITRSIVSHLVDNTFTYVDAYAKQQFNKLAGKAPS